MASTYTVLNGITYTQAIVVGMPVSAIQVAAADRINSIIWNAYPWRWAVHDIGQIALVDGTQEYDIAEPNYMRGLKATLTRTDTTPDQFDELTIVKNLAADLTKAGFRSGLSQVQILHPLSFGGTTLRFRLNQAAAIPSGVTVTFGMLYQVQPTKITATSATLPFPDQYFSVFCEGMLWQFMMLGKDSRAGTAVSNGKGGVSYTGQMAIFYDALMAMREAEDYGAGDNTFPSESLGFAGAFSSFSGIYGP